jgi:hypothetical protein
MKGKALIAQPKVQGALIRERFTAQESYGSESITASYV